ncbi:MAG: 3-isopropylmalate dehydrogenase [Promethearchaeia archaeon]|nr:MAG: 3-isopropylmalate dehydrogenase [Candidatus Lokiarchaeia archaeon]
MEKTIAIAKGDGIGPEVINEGVKILKIIGQYTNYDFNLIETPLGGEVYKQTGTNLPEKSFNLMKSSDAILFGAIGVPDLPAGVAESAILKMRQGFDLYVNLRPVKQYEPLQDICPLKPEFFPNGIDISIIRENTEGLYARIGGIVNKDSAVNSMVYSRKAVERIIQYAFEFAVRKNHTEIISVDKANMLACSEFWREIFNEQGKKYPQISKKHFYVDAFCQWLIRSPSTIQTVVTENMFGDIISDEAAMLIGSLGMVPSANINPNGLALFEPIHGSAPDIAGKNIANPIGAILSCKLMIEEKFNDPKLAQFIEKAVITSLEESRTLDIYPRSVDKTKKLKKTTCSDMGTIIGNELKKILKN